MSDLRFPEPKLRDEFRRELRNRLMAEAQTVLAPRPRGTSWTFLRPAFAVGLAAVLLMAGAGSAAASSVPGDAAFGLKRAAEELQLVLTADDVARVELLAQLSERRLRELERVADRPDKAPTASEEYAAAVARFRAAVDALQLAAPQEKKDRAQEVADAAREKQAEVLESLRDRLPERAKEALERAREEQERDTPERKKQKDRDKDKDDDHRSADSTRSPRPSATPRATETARPDRTSTPRPAQTTSRPGGTVRPTERPDDD